MSVSSVPLWLSSLSEEDFVLMKRFILNSGSLKALAETYEVSYPTMRLRLDRLIARIEASEAGKSEFESMLKDLTLSEAIEAKTARRLLELHEREIRAAARED